jgi:hypothetical protein
MHFTYSEQPAEAGVLNQGDVLKRTPELEQLLQQYYSYFAENKDNKFFLVITQACDLVPREGGFCKAKYVQLAAVRPLRVAIEREMAAHAQPGFDLGIPVAGQKARTRFEAFLERLFNNNEQEHFYLHRDPTTELVEDHCAFLNLSVPIKAEHYGVCVAARILTLQPMFQAKLGWLVGQMYARVGTDDWKPEDLRKNIRDIAKDAGYWVDDKTLAQARATVQAWRAAHPDAVLDVAELAKLVKGLPTKKSLAVSHLNRLLTDSPMIHRLTSAGTVTNDDLERLVNGISSDQQFSALFS